MNKITCHDLTAINFDNNQQKGVIERFISRIHHADCDTMDDARLQLLLRKGEALQKLPMTSHTLKTGDDDLCTSHLYGLWTQPLKKTFTLYQVISNYFI